MKSRIKAVVLDRLAEEPIRQDAYAKAHPFEAEQEKPEAERGFYLSPVEHGLPESMGNYVSPKPEVGEKVQARK